MSILLVDEPKVTESLKPQLERTTGCSILQIPTLAEALGVLLTAQPRVQIGVFAINHERDCAFHFIKAVNRLGATGRVPRPFLLAFSEIHQPPEFAVKLDKFGIQLLLRKYPEQIVEAVRRLQWQVRTTNGLPTIIIERRGGQIVGAKVHYRGTTERLSVGPRLSALVAYVVVHRKTEHSTQTLADALGISPQSVKEYFLRLRGEFDRIRTKLGISRSGKEVFWTRRMPGGFIHGLKANGEIEDSEEFFLPEEDCHDSAAVLPCHLCLGMNSRSKTAWTHRGWMCADCADELHQIGEL